MTSENAAPDPEAIAALAAEVIASPPPAPTSNGTTDVPVSTAVAVVLSCDDPGRAVEVVVEAKDAVPPSSRLEFLVPDDPTHPRRREVFEALRSTDDVTRFVPMSGSGRAADLDRLVDAATSEFLVFPSADVTRLAGLAAVFGRMWVEGADAAAVLGGGDVPPPGDDAARLVVYLGLVGPHRGSVVVLRRWAAKWLLNRVDTAIDAAEEVADRARLLGLSLCEVRSSP